jgi:hypothetical protein
VVGVGIGEEKVELMRAELLGKARSLLSDLPLQVDVTLGQLVDFDQVASALLESGPGRDQFAVLGSLTRHLAGAARLVPCARPGELRV